MSNNPNGNQNLNQQIPQYPQQYNPQQPTQHGYPQQTNPYYPQQYQPQQQNYVQPKESQQAALNKALEIREINRLIPRHEGSSWGSLEFRPKHVRFETQNRGERVYILVRRHWITNIGWIIRNILYVFIPIIFLYLIDRFNIEADFINARNNFLVMLAFYSLLVTNVLREFFDWYFDPYIVTNDRVMDYDFKPFTSYKIREATLDNIEDVKQISAGPVASLLNYGDIKIKTASDRGEIDFQAVPNPSRIRDVIADLATIAKQFSYANPND